MTNQTGENSDGAGPTEALASAVGQSWRGFLESCEPLRPELYRYCRYLTRSPWDAEDLAQDVLAQAFTILSRMGHAPPNPRAWLFRVASNLWIDRLRRERVSSAEEQSAAEPSVASPDVQAT